MRRTLIVLIFTSIVVSGMSATLLDSKSDVESVSSKMPETGVGDDPLQQELSRQVQVLKDDNEIEAANEADKKELTSPNDHARRTALKKIKDRSIKIELQQKEIRERIERLKTR